jgi:hypothetical protein
MVRCPMPSAQLLKQLEEAERYVAEGEDNLRRQRQIIAEMERRGHDSSVVRDLLTLFEQVQAVHIGARDRAMKDIEEAD